MLLCVPDCKIVVVGVMKGRVEDCGELGTLNITVRLGKQTAFEESYSLLTARGHCPVQWAIISSVGHTVCSYVCHSKQISYWINDLHHYLAHIKKILVSIERLQSLLSWN